MLRFIVYAVPLLVLLLALFGFAVELLDFEPRRGSVIRLALFDQPRVPGQLVLGTWLVESAGLIALFLLARGRFGRWWLDGLVAGWIGWIFRGPLLVITIVVAVRQPQDPWWTLAFGWWALYSVCGLSLAFLARRSGLDPWSVGPPEAATEAIAAIEETTKSDEVTAPEAGTESDEVTAPGEASESEEAKGSEETSEPVEASEPVETTEPTASSDLDQEPMADTDGPVSVEEPELSDESARTSVAEPGGSRQK